MLLSSYHRIDFILSSSGSVAMRFVISTRLSFHCFFDVYVHMSTRYFPKILSQKCPLFGQRCPIAERYVAVTYSDHSIQPWILDEACGALMVLRFDHYAKVYL